MTETILFNDRSTIRATRTPEGFLIDTPIVGRVGIQNYPQEDGSTLRLLRPPDEVFSKDSLESMQGKPITMGHTFVSVENARQATIGATSSAGFRDGNFVRTKISIFVGDAIESILSGDTQELSLGYGAVIHPTPGWWNDQTLEIIWKSDSPSLPANLPIADWQEFDAVQRYIRINHLAVVQRARAGRAARLNVDEDDMTLVKVKIGDAEHEVPVAVKTQLDALQDALTQERSKKSTNEAALQGLQAKIDQQQALIDGFGQEKESLKQTWQAENKIRAELEVSAKQFGVACDSLSNKEIKLEMLKRAGAGDLSEKPDAYIDAAFDLRKPMFGADAAAYGIGDGFGGGMRTMSGADPLDVAYQNSYTAKQE
ncbi:DUF2213 domain-containing protein [Lelliottia wanjuensis]|uniref:DUF2213 domain-containing protein n=1 Tax=Lelliottia wanjuensis TaxID=3050585 RepID=UPI00254B0054|nr:DUF2213 domain-containing protein [Lelliottia sp. V104_15]MDK9607103.1 DUF2213 domain-containing protein [Lelliottia sp. V104_15]